MILRVMDGQVCGSGPVQALKNTENL